MNVIEKLKKSIETVGVPFFYGSPGDINRVLDRAPLPCAFAYLLETNAATDTNGICRERLTLAVFFVDKTTFDFEAIENEDIIGACKVKALQWYTRMRTSDDFRNLTLNNTVRVYDELADATVTGYALNVTLEEVEGIGACNL